MFPVTARPPMAFESHQSRKTFVMFGVLSSGSGNTGLRDLQVAALAVFFSIRGVLMKMPRGCEYIVCRARGLNGLVVRLCFWTILT